MLKKYVIILDENANQIIKGEYDQIQINQNKIILFEETGTQIIRTYIEVDFTKVYIQII